LSFVRLKTILAPIESATPAPAGETRIQQKNSISAQDDWTMSTSVLMLLYAVKWIWGRGKPGRIASSHTMRFR
jgi:hypothetical protein